MEPAQLEQELEKRAGLRHSLFIPGTVNSGALSIGATNSIGTAMGLKYLLNKSGVKVQ
jgi:hypothetical protein